uniref:Uncharacterized protein n=1 Tax=Chrysotila carterae TaxID=13221 RepID=A0A6T0ATM2_CHRCT
MAERVDDKFAQLHIHTVKELGEWPFFLWARAIVTLAAKEISNKRESASKMNINQVRSRAPSRSSGRSVHPRCSHSSCLTPRRLLPLVQFLHPDAPACVF